MIGLIWTNDLVTLGCVLIEKKYALREYYYQTLEGYTKQGRPFMAQILGCQKIFGGSGLQK